MNEKIKQLGETLQRKEENFLNSNRISGIVRLLWRIEKKPRNF